MAMITLYGELRLDRCSFLRLHSVYFRLHISSDIISDLDIHPDSDSIAVALRSSLDTEVKFSLNPLPETVYEREVLVGKEKHDEKSDALYFKEATRFMKTSFEKGGCVRRGEKGLFESTTCKGELFLHALVEFLCANNPELQR